MVMVRSTVPAVVARMYSSSAARKLRETAAATIEEARAAGTFKRERVITGPQQALITVASESKPVLNFCANNYLGLSNHPAVLQRAKEAIDTHGMGLSSVRFICGTQDLHKSVRLAPASDHSRPTSSSGMSARVDVRDGVCSSRPR